jgi:hypothetical protein
MTNKAILSKLALREANRRCKNKNENKKIKPSILELTGSIFLCLDFFCTLGRCFFILFPRNTKLRVASSSLWRVPVSTRWGDDRTRHR